jgi:hypothetical protein
MFSSIIAGYLLICFVKKKLKQRQLKKLVTNNPRGGAFLEDWTERNHNKPYKITDHNLKLIIRDLLRKYVGKKRPLIVITFVRFLAAVNQSNLGVQIALFGTEFVIANRKTFAGKEFSRIAVRGLLYRSLLRNLPTKVIVLVTYVSTTLLAAFLIRNVPCNRVLEKLPQMEVERTLSNLDKKKYYMYTSTKKIEEKNFLKNFINFEESEIYFLEKLKFENCSTQIDKSGRMTWDCDNQKIYVKLNDIKITEKQEKERGVKQSVQYHPETIENSLKPSEKRSEYFKESPLFKRKKYVPLEKRTKTFSQLRKEFEANRNSSQSSETIENSLKPSEKRSEHFKEAKLHIRNHNSDNPDEL